MRRPERHAVCPRRDVITVGSIRFTVLETPGHTPGSVVFQTDRALFTGDTLFAGSCGRVDFPGGDWGQMCASLRRLAGLEGNFRVYPATRVPAIWTRSARAIPSCARPCAWAER